MRLDDVVYEDAGFTSTPARQFDLALEASCDDVGPDSAGTAFDSRSQDVQVWAFEGFNHDQVLGVQVGDNFRVMTAVSLSQPASTSLLEAVSAP